MKRTAILLMVALLAAVFTTNAHALDTVKTADDTVSGEITSISSLQVVVKRGNASREIQAGDIESINFDGEPAVLKTARIAVSAGRYEDAVEALSGMNTAEIQRRAIVQDIEYYKAYSTAQLALVGSGDIAQAGSMVYAFLNANKDSYHYLDAQMLFGDLAGAIGKPQAAQQAYIAVGKVAPWPAYRARAAVALGRSYLDEGKIAEASNSFKAALSTPDTDAEVQALKLAATLGEARCLAATKKLDEATSMIEKVIKQADSENFELLAEAYNALGSSYRASNRPKDAVLAFLHVDLVYFNSPLNHIEALQNLIQLWNELKMPERSAEAARVLRDRYKRSPQ